MRSEIRADGRKIAEMRAARVMTLDEFARVCGISRPVLCKIEAGGVVSHQTARRVAGALEQPVEDLFTAELR